ncbi:MAG: FAD-dependent oxidoreductase [Acidobacteria bacterium]|jgi:thioredoxin reductase (NADPH)|nr:FAD-dependent oxidoreductase [Acidobacteriota bacterium]
MNFDVIIIGGGAAGLSAGLWCAELGLNALLLEANIELGGQLLWVYNSIENHLGSKAENGRELRDVFVRQIENRRLAIRLQSEINDINLEKREVFLSSGEKISARFLIIATGTRRRKLNVEGEEKFKNKGIIESGKRDAKTVKDKEVCVIGGGDAAFENALVLAETASKVTLAHRRKDFRARAEFIEQIQNNQKIKILTETILRKIIGNEQVEAVELEDLNTKERFTVNVQAIIFRVGVEPNTEFLRGRVALDENGYIKINQNCETNIEGIFAVGDVANPLAPTVSSAVGMGATAVKIIFAN